MEQKVFTISLLTLEDGATVCETQNDGFQDFELIGILFNVLQKTQMKLNEKAQNNLEKEMD